jgi:predicted acylesterase/phospholipase RssA
MNYTNFVIGGAGTKNYASLGAIKKIEHIIPNIKKFLGVSSGSILATLLAIGCSAEELKKFFRL